MDKQKLVRIILKDLEELKNLSEEISVTEEDVALIVDLAMHKSKLITHEIDLLHEYTGTTSTSRKVVPTEIQEEQNKVEKDQMEFEEDTEPEVSAPEMEILNFDVADETEEQIDEPALPQEETMEEEPEVEPEQEEKNETEQEEKSEPVEEFEPEEETEEQDEIGNPEEETQEEVEEEQEEIETEETEDIEEEEEEIVYDEDTDEEEREETEEEPIEEERPDPEIEINRLDDDSQPEIREIHIDELEDEEADSYKFAPVDKSAEHPAFHEIPKPESAPKEKQVIGEKFKKEPSLNDSMAEKKAMESQVSNGPISSLRASIGLNDRFLFIREIFDNDAERYNTIIDNLDKLNTIQNAVEYLKANLTLEKNETSMKFVELLKRRFTK